ncbi:FecR domain-containing protein [Seonamhaeicola sp.]|uniref:FecR family protein n=1 Tax=Seonamhaeicola sp. TaxID=1912245 RepID=UPI002623BFD0|nr:FecR domain-containing protein [Seonamhaeicola sp.]
MKHIISKYINNEATEAEINMLEIWLESKKNRKVFKEYLNIDYLVKQDLEFDALKAYEEVVQNLSAPKVIPLYKRNIFKYAVAASVVLLLSLPFVLNNIKGTDNTSVIVNNQIDSGTDKAVLTLENGTVVNLEKGKAFKVEGLVSNGEKIVYDAKKTSKAIAYNYLEIPRGGQFNMELSDGTRVWLNSESKIKYPKEFIEGQTREVELIYGEAYFDVSPSTKHGGARFKVSTALQEVEVLGTEFNVKAYKNEAIVYTTLVEGKVAVENESASAFLEPNQQSIVSGNTSEIKVNDVDVFDEVSWKNGVFSFNNKPLKDIVAVLARWYDADISIENPDIENLEFNGVLRKNKSLEDILNSIINTNDFAYEITDKKVILK